MVKSRPKFLSKFLRGIIRINSQVPSCKTIRLLRAGNAHLNSVELTFLFLPLRTRLFWKWKHSQLVLKQLIPNHNYKEVNHTDTSPFRIKVSVKVSVPWSEPQSKAQALSFRATARVPTQLKPLSSLKLWIHALVNKSTARVRVLPSSWSSTNQTLITFKLLNRETLLRPSEGLDDLQL